ncbi:hypothetical protein [Bacteroides bouchesdurhonensis]|uniref:hypothetical protein n=1 Tax=Bacteroides bouchesdurhonensis TaxID=1841855 RepID=UPI00097F7121|nr:hypothetical protein [Bacteroides bouchesdurhonensis]
MEIAKKFNKRVQKRKAGLKKSKMVLIIYFIVITSPIWLYAGIIRGVILPYFGEKTIGVLSGLREASSWNQYHRYDPSSYYCTFNVNGKSYKSNSTISVEDTLYHLGDTVIVIYLSHFPIINTLDLSNE